MPISKAMAKLWSKAENSFRTMVAQADNDNNRLPTRRDLREHQQTIQDIIDVFNDTLESNVLPPPQKKLQPVPMISPSETSSAHSFFPTTSHHTPSILQQQTSFVAPPIKRKATEIEKAGRQKASKKAHQQNTTSSTLTSHHTTPLAAKPTAPTLTAEDDAYIWDRFLRHREAVQRLGLSEKAWEGFPTRIAETLHTNRQAITARLKVLKKKHGYHGNSEGSAGSGGSDDSGAESDGNSLMGGGGGEVERGGVYCAKRGSARSGPGENESVESFSRSAGDSSDTSSGDSESDTSSGSSSGRERAGSGRGSGRNMKKSSSSSSSKGSHNNNNRPTNNPPTKKPSNTTPKHNTTTPTTTPTSTTPTSTTTHARHTHRLYTPEAPLTPPPTITRKSTFTATDDAVIWNAYVLNGCTVLRERQCARIAKRLKRTGSSGVSYRVERLMSEDQSVPMKDIQDCLFSDALDAAILRAHHANLDLPNTTQRSEEEVCSRVALNIGIDSVRVLYRLRYLLRQDNSSDSGSDTSSVHSTYRPTSNTTKSTPSTRVRISYTEEDDMLLWTAYLSSGDAEERGSALHSVATQLGRTYKAVMHRMHKLLSDQHTVAAAATSYSSDSNSNSDSGSGSKSSSSVSSVQVVVPGRSASITLTRTTNNTTTTTTTTTTTPTTATGMDIVIPPVPTTVKRKRGRPAKHTAYPNTSNSPTTTTNTTSARTKAVPPLTPPTVPAIHNTNNKSTTSTTNTTNTNKLSGGRVNTTPNYKRQRILSTIVTPTNTTNTRTMSTRSSSRSSKSSNISSSSDSDGSSDGDGDEGSGSGSGCDGDGVNGSDSSDSDVVCIKSTMHRSPSRAANKAKHTNTNRNSNNTSNTNNNNNTTATTTTKPASYTTRSSARMKSLSESSSDNNNNNSSDGEEEEVWGNKKNSGGGGGGGGGRNNASSKGVGSVGNGNCNTNRGVQVITKEHLLQASLAPPRTKPTSNTTTTPTSKQPSLTVTPTSSTNRLPPPPGRPASSAALAAGARLVGARIDTGRSGDNGVSGGGVSGSVGGKVRNSGGSNSGGTTGAVSSSISTTSTLNTTHTPIKSTDTSSISSNSVNPTNPHAYHTRYIADATYTTGLSNLTNLRALAALSSTNTIKTPNTPNTTCTAKTSVDVSKGLKTEDVYSREARLAAGSSTSGSGSDVGRQHSLSSGSPVQRNFLAMLFHQGMFVATPQLLHDQVIGLVLGCLLHLHATAALPLYNTFLSALRDALQLTQRALPRLHSLSSDQLCKAVVLLMRADVLLIHGGPHLDLPMTIKLVDYRGVAEVRRRHDAYLEDAMGRSGGVVQDLLWPESAAEQTRLSKEVEEVVKEVRRVLSSGGGGDNEKVK